MHWKLLSKKELVNIKHERELPGISRSSQGYALITEEGAYWLIAPHTLPEDIEQKLPVAELSPEELQDESVWTQLLGFFGGHSVDLANYSRKHPEIPEGIFLRFLGKGEHYKNLADWKELGELNASAQEAARFYNFPVNTLRLYNRFPESDQQELFSLWQKRNIKKNLVREMIQDFYDLSLEKREQALKLIGEFSDNWKAKSGNFPGEELRRIIRDLRYPMLQQAREEIRSLKQELDYEPGTNLELPEDLESSRMKLTMEFTSVEKLRNLLNKLGKEENIEKIERLFKKISDQE